MMVNFTATSYILWPFGIFLVILVFFPVWVCCTKKNLAAVLLSRFFKYFVLMQKLSGYVLHPIIRDAASGQMWHYATLPRAGHSNITSQSRLLWHPVS
jgi:hypothetical protein